MPRSSPDPRQDNRSKAASLSWLHLSDLHQGMQEQPSLMPTVRAQLFEDLERLAEFAGPWDLVLFTGDLTQTGAAAEFALLSETLERLWEVLVGLGSRPYFLAVPGNHDLLRPKPSAVVWALRHWHEERGIREEFWRGAENEYRRCIEEAFAAYTAWLSDFQRIHPPPSGLKVTLHLGELPGDFSAGVSKGGLDVGIVGLNSAFLHLTADNHEGRLHIDPRQLHAACGGDGPEWIKQHHANFLLTHHPPEWLHPETRARFLAEIAPPGWFDAHLFGHMHEPTAEFRQIAGAPVQRRLQGASLFGLEIWADKHVRTHGYSAGRLTVRGDSGRLSIWPRIALTVHGGYRKLIPDHSFFLARDGAFHTDLTVRPMRPSPESSDRPSSLVHAIVERERRQVLHDPGGPYEPGWYVHRTARHGAVQDADAEEAMLGRLRQPGQPVALWAPELFGKTWFLKHALKKLTSEDPDFHAVQVNLRVVSVGALQEFARFCHRFAELLAESLQLDPQIAMSVMTRPGTPANNLSWFLMNPLLSATRGPVVLAIDQADELLQTGFCDDFFGLLRAWADRAESEPWSRLRVAVAMSTTPALMTTTPARSPFANRTSHVRLTDLGRNQVQELARGHGLSWGDTHISELMNLVGGHPFLVRLAMVNAARHPSLPLSELLHESNPLFETFLDGLRWRLSKDRGLFDAFRAMIGDPGRTADPVAYLRLRDAGVIRQVDNVYELRYRLYERLVPPVRKLKS